MILFICLCRYWSKEHKELITARKISTKSEFLPTQREIRTFDTKEDQPKDLLDQEGERVTEFRLIREHIAK